MAKKFEATQEAVQEERMKMLAQLRTIKTELAKSGGGGGASSKEMEALRDAGKIEAIGPVLCIDVDWYIFYF